MNSSTQTLYRTSVVTALGMIAYFLLMKLLGLATAVELRFFNLFILAAGIRHVLRAEKKAHEGHLRYFRGLSAGFFMAALSSLVFSLLLFVYLSLIDRSLMNYILETQPFGDFLNPWAAALIVFVEGLASGAILSFALTNLYYSDKHG
jgi:hypothetical protein